MVIAAHVFVNQHERPISRPEFPMTYIEDVVRVMVEANWHTYQVLTKSSERLLDASQLETRILRPRSPYLVGG